MRKLILTSLKFKTGENTHDDLMLVVVNSKGDEIEDQISATKAVVDWFPLWYPESELIHALAKPTLIATDSPGTISQKTTGALQEAFSATNPPIPSKFKVETSDDVLIDLNGHRKDFAIGFYDHNEKEWRFYTRDISLKEDEHMMWMYLPLAKYDK